MMPVGILQSVQVGTSQQYTDAEGTWQSSFFRMPGSQPCWLYTTHLEGDEKADKKNHGSLEQAVLLYAAAHYPLWQIELSQPEIGPGGFGEYFTVDGLTEDTACIGDIYAIGEAHIQVTQPRYPCWKIERRWGIAGLTARVAASGRTGWFCRVIQEGLIQPGSTIILIDRPYPQWTIALINNFGHGRNTDGETAQALASCPLLNKLWRKLIIHHAVRKDHE